jgi:RHS repeat-associated protein
MHERDFSSECNDRTVLDYMHARFYSSSWGRFTAVDPVEGSPLRPQSWNGYAYVGLNPMNFTDASGRRRFGSFVSVTAKNDTTAPDELALYLAVLGWEDFQNFVDFGSGLANGLSSDILLGAGRYERENSGSYTDGQLAGDAAATILGGAEMITGASGFGGGGIMTGTGFGAVIGIPAMAVSATVAAHGGALTAVASWHLMSGIKQRKEGKHGTFRGRDAKRANDESFSRVVNNLKLTPDEQRRLHLEISGEGLGYDDILAVARSMFDKWD